MSTKTPTPQDEDFYNRAQRGAEALSNGEQTAGDAVAQDQRDSFEDEFGGDNYNKDAPTSGSDVVKQKENDINYTGSGKNSPKQPFSLRGQLKKKGPLLGIGGGLLGAIVGIMVFVAPGLGVVHMAEVLTDDLNDQFGAMDIRTTHVFKAKLSGLGKNGSICIGAKVRCGFKGMSNRQIRNFEKAGFTIEKDGKTKFGKNKIASMQIETSNGKVTINGPKEFNKLLGDRKVRNSLRRAFNPKLAGFSDFVSFKVFGRLKTNKASKLTGSTTEEKNKNLNQAVDGEKAQVDPKNTAASDDDSKAQADDKKAANDSANNSANSLEAKEGVSTKSVFSSVAKNGATSAARGLSITGVADVACSVKNTGRAVEATAKVVRAAQLARFAMVFLTFASSLKANTATADQAEYIGNKLTATDTNKEIVDETSKIGSDGNTATKVKNPDYGKSAFDSDGFKVAAYNEAPILSARSLGYTVGGGVAMGTLATANAFVQNTLKGTNCKFIQNNIVRVGGLALGIGLGAVTLGTTLFVSIGASAGIGMLLPILQNYLAQMLAGKVVDADTNGVDAGNAIFAGTAKLQGDIAMGRGMEPQSSGEFKNYIAATQSVKDEYIAMETEDAQSTPFDVYNQYSFLGSFARKLLPLQTTPATAGGAIANSVSFVGTALSSVVPRTSATQVFNEDRFNRCVDQGYAKLGIDADVFCNPRYGLSEKEMQMDTDAVIEYMNPKYVTDDGIPKERYSDWLAECVDRTAGWGEKPDSEENGGEGYDCKEETRNGKKSIYSPTQLSNFRVYTLDKSIYEAMDFIEPTGTGLGELNIGTYNLRSSALTGNVQERSQLAASTISSSEFDVIGVQEGQDDQIKIIDTELKDKYKYKTLATRTIFWKKNKYTLEKSGKFTVPKESLSRPNPMLWVKLSSATTSSFYVVDIHADVDSKANRKKTAQIVLDLIKNKLNDGSPVFVVGDMNSEVNQEIYNTFVDSGKLIAAYDQVTGVKENDNCNTTHKIDSQNCQSTNTRGRHIDQVFMTPDPNAEVTSWENIISNATNRASDHNPVLVNIRYADSTIANESGVVGENVQGDDYKNNCAKYASCTKQCVDFVLYRLKKHGVDLTTNAIGNGKDVVRNLGNMEYKVNRTPAVNSVLSTSQTSTPQWGHTAMVSKVNADGSIVVEEYNYNNTLAYGTRTISAAEIRTKNITFAHTEVAYK